MNYSKLRETGKLYFGYEEISRILEISAESARVTASRYTRQGLLVRVKRNMYILRERWERLSREERFTLANAVQVPSYISLMTALDYYGITTQIQQSFVESVGTRRTKETGVDGWVFRYTKIDEDRYFGFSRERGFFIATPEKAFVDAAYLISLGRYSFDETSIDFKKIRVEDVRSIARKFPLRTRKTMERWMS